ncbi:MAG TPA: pyrimidine 5'-nucleotidase [Rhodospirillaceae bacterium]|nr:pyrimidine 5'-nucleotidase [Rhodospirillaceae bacterium]
MSAFCPPDAYPVPPRLERVEHWIFDLDNTLYPASCSLFPQIDARMRHFIAETLQLSQDEAHRLQKHYYHQYGTTLRGLMLAHGLEPSAFLSYVHDIDHSVLVPTPALDQALAALPGRKIIFTNGTRHHAEKVLSRLTIAHHFDGIFDIEAADYLPKPNAETYLRMALRHGIPAQQAAMFEDLAVNLRPAAAAGMATILVCEPAPDTGHPGAPAVEPHIHHVTYDLAGFLDSLAPKR